MRECHSPKIILWFSYLKCYALIHSELGHNTDTFITSSFPPTDWCQISEVHWSLLFATLQSIHCRIILLFLFHVRYKTKSKGEARHQTHFPRRYQAAGWANGVTMQLDDFLQVTKDVFEVFWWKDTVSVQPLAENTVQDFQHPQVGALRVEQLWWWKETKIKHVHASCFDVTGFG